MVRLLVRRHRILLTAWPLGILLLLAITAPSYHANYGDGLVTAPAVRQLGSSPTLAMLYGRFPDPATLGGLVIWEAGFYVLLLGSVMAIFAAATMTRGAEDAGLIELVRSVGVAPTTPLRAALAVLTGLCMALGMGVAAVLAIQAQIYAGMALSGAVLFGAVVTATSLTMGLCALIAAQLRDSRAAARGLGLGLLALVYALRAVADNRDWEALRWVSPLGWRDLVEPYASQQWWVLIALGIICVILAAVALRLGHRDLGAAWITSRAGSNRNLHVAGPTSWAFREAAGALLGWSITVVALAAVFGSMAKAMVDALTDDPDLAAQLAAMGFAQSDAVATFYAFLGATVALLIMIAAVGYVRRWRGDEKSGWLAHELATGTPRAASLAARIAVAATFAAAATLVAGTVMGACAAVQFNDPQLVSYGLTAFLGQLPAIITAMGIAALLIAVLPRLSAAIWLLVGASGLLYFLGGMLNIPERIINVGLLAHAPESTPNGWPDWGLWLGGSAWILLAVGMVSGVAAVATVRHRDLELH